MIAFRSRYAKAISEDNYLCLVPDLATLDPEYIRTFGIPSTGFDDADKELENRRSKVMIPIITILHYFLEGIDITIPNDEDILNMHRVITAYLDEWKYHLENDINIRVTEYSDLLRGLEELNVALYNMLTPEEFEETIPKAPDIFVKALNVSKTETQKTKIPNYKDQYGTMFSMIRDRERFENNN